MNDWPVGMGPDDESWSVFTLIVFFFCPIEEAQKSNENKKRRKRERERKRWQSLSGSGMLLALPIPRDSSTFPF